MTLSIEELSLEAFAPFGNYAVAVNPSALKIGTVPIEFFRDMLQLELGRATPSFSVCRVEPRPFVVDVSEFHSKTAELLLPLDGDTLMHVAPAMPSEAAFPAEQVRVFRVPQGTMVALRPGVWHHAPFAVGKQPVNVLVVLPERTYANDCTVAEVKPPLQIEG